MIPIETALIDGGIITESEMQRVRDASKRTGMGVLRMLPELGLVSETQLV